MEQVGREQLDREQSGREQGERVLPGGVVVRQVRPQDWEQLRSLRLEMLADTPLAYLERLEDARSKPAAG